MYVVVCNKCGKMVEPESSYRVMIYDNKELANVSDRKNEGYIRTIDLCEECERDLNHYTHFGRIRQGG